MGQGKAEQSKPGQGSQAAWESKGAFWCCAEQHGSQREPSGVAQSSMGVKGSLLVLRRAATTVSKLGTQNSLLQQGLARLQHR